MNDEWELLGDLAKCKEQLRVCSRNLERTRDAHQEQIMALHSAMSKLTYSFDSRKRMEALFASIKKNEGWPRIGT